MATKEDASLDPIRHSLAHLLAAAVLKKFPDAKLGIGPTIENGFYYRHAAQVWGAIAAACRAADTQLFATTHSREWVLAAHTAFAESKTYDEDFRLHRMEGVDSAIRAVTYDKGTLQAAIDTDLELR